MMSWLLLAFVLCGLVAMIATIKGRSGVSWFVYALLVFPVAFVHVLMIRSRRPETGVEPRTAAQADAEIAAKLRQDDVIRHPGDGPPAPR
ncbi:MAG: hypothetical protein NTY59_14270 [Alphaproteobacteria bacterium]|nr:hypothetical protein [Alphaproteobacteria bacterium]